MALIKRPGVAVLLPLLCALVACGADNHEPGQRDLEAAIRERIEHDNDRGGVKINLGSAGAFQNLRFDIRLHTVSKHHCTGGDRVYVCDVTYTASFPPVKEEQESIDTQVTMFDGPGGWRLIE